MVCFIYPVHLLPKESWFDLIFKIDWLIGQLLYVEIELPDNLTNDLGGGLCLFDW